ncbi:hypothetical protein [Caudoviricetes sp.]|nr:hypothetical protein [Caudoviricetes sp.]
MIALNSFGELVMKHKGARICVMGGAPSLADDIAKVDADIWISTNTHGAKLRSVDYVVAMDNTHTETSEFMEGVIREVTDAPIIGPWHWANYGLTDYPLAPRVLLSGVVAQWAAYMMGAHPVIMAGFDCYGNTNRSKGMHKEYIPFVRGGQIRVVSGPLIGIWPEYNKDEVLPDQVDPTFIGSFEHGVLVQVIKPVEIRGRTFPKGTVLRAPKAEVWRQIKHRSLIELAEDPGLKPPEEPSVNQENPPALVADPVLPDASPTPEVVSATAAKASRKRS